MEYNNMFNSDVSQSTLDMAGKVSVTAATWKLLYEKGVDMVELFTWSRTDGYSIVKPEIRIRWKYRKCYRINVLRKYWLKQRNL